MAALTVEAANTILHESFAPWVLALGIRCDSVATDTATLRIPFDERLCRIGGIVCGQSLASGADTAMVLALAVAMGGLKPLTTVDMTVNFLRPVTKADSLIEAKVMRLGKTLAFCTCEIREDGSAKPAAFATGTYALLG